MVPSPALGFCFALQAIVHIPAEMRSPDTPPPPPPHASVWFCKPLFIFLMKRTLLLVFICLYIGWYFIVPLTCQYYLVMSYLLPHCTTEAMFDNKCDLLLNLKYFGDHEDSNFQKADYIKLKSAYPELLYRKLDFILANNACL